MSIHVEKTVWKLSCLFRENLTRGATSPVSLVFKENLYRLNIDFSCTVCYNIKSSVENCSKQEAVRASVPSGARRLYYGGGGDAASN